MRRPLDAYYTPDALARRLVEVTDLRYGLMYAARVVEPSAGGGAFVRALREVGAQVHAVDVNRDAPGLRDAESYDVCDWLEWEPRWKPPEWVIGNPPYSDAEAHIRHALAIATDGVAMLLRLAMLESARRVSLWREHPAARVYVLAERPSFTGGGTDSAAYGWFVWRRGHEGPASLEVLSWK